MKHMIFTDARGRFNGAAWHTWRSEGIGSTDAGIIGVEAGMVDEPLEWQLRFDQLYREKVGEGRLTADGYAIQRGGMGESECRKSYEKLTGNLVARVFGESDKWPVMRASFDGVSLCGRLLSEFKCPAKKVLELAARKIIPEAYLPQLAHQGMTAWGHPDHWKGDEQIDFVAFDPETGKIHVVEIRARHQLGSYAADLYKSERLFWDMVEKRVAPCGEGWFALADSYRRVLEDAVKANLEVEKCKARMIQYCEGQKRKRIEDGGVLFYHQERRGQVDVDKMLEAHGFKGEDTEIEKNKYRKKGTSCWNARLMDEAAETPQQMSLVA